MTVKRFVAPDMRRALDLVRSEMGPDAIILSSQRTSQGVEIITSVELDSPARGADERTAFGKQFESDMDWPLDSDQAWKNQQQLERAAQQYPGAELAPPARRGETLAREIEAARQRLVDAKRMAAGARSSKSIRSTQTGPVPTEMSRGKASGHTVKAAGTQTNRQMAGLAEQVRQRNPKTDDTAGKETGDSRLQQLQHEIADMRLLLEQQMWRMRDSDPVAQKAPPQSLAVEALENRLTRLGLPQHLVRRLATCATPDKHLSVAWREALARLARLIPIDNRDPISKGGLFAFVGPTGVGKTTTIAKLASRYVLENGLGKVALITTDTYRVGAHDQLRALGRILNVPVRVVDQERSLAQTVASLRSFPLILIDTAGFRQGDPLRKEQDRILGTCPGVQRILTLACNSQAQTLKASAHAYGSERLGGCILTKIDESACLGEALGVLIERNLPVLYSSDGQGIPKDITTASAATLVAKAVGLLKASQTAEAEVALSP